MGVKLCGKFACHAVCRVIYRMAIFNCMTISLDFFRGVTLHEYVGGSRSIIESTVWALFYMDSWSLYVSICVSASNIPLLTILLVWSVVGSRQ